MNATSELAGGLRATLAASSLLALAASFAAAQQAPSAGVTRSVRVVTRDNQPVADATVEVWPTLEDACVGEPLCFESDAEGIAHVVIPVGWQALTASKEGVGRSAVARSNFSVLQLVEMRRVRGQVLWSDGQPEPGALVYGLDSDPRFAGLFGADDDSGANAFSEAFMGTKWVKVPPSRTDAEGNFEIDVLRDDVPLYAESRGLRTAPRSLAIFDMTQEPMVLRFPGAYRVTGRVTGPFEVGDARVFAPDWGSTEPHMAEVADDGSFELLLAEPDIYPICATLDGWVQHNEVVVTVDDVMRSVSVELNLVRGTTISGHLRDREGVPLRARVSAVSDDIWVRSGPTREGDDPWADYLLFHSPSAGTDETGAFVLSGIQPGKTYTLCTQLWARRGVLTRTLRAGASGMDFVSDDGARWPTPEERRTPAALVGIFDRHR